MKTYNFASNKGRTDQKYLRALREAEKEFGISIPEFDLAETDGTVDFRAKSERTGRLEVAGHTIAVHVVVYPDDGPTSEWEGWGQVTVQPPLTSGYCL